MKNTLAIEGLFEGRIFRVPDYQRGYAWESLQRAELLEDLDLLGAGREHYTGTIVLQEIGTAGRRISADGRSFGVVEVVDGQQRLATVVLLLDSLRRELVGIGSVPAQNLANGIKMAYIATPDIAGQPIYRLSLNPDCDHYFRTVAINDSPGPEGPQIFSERRLRDARDEFKKYFNGRREAHGSGYQDWLIDLYQKIAHRMQVSIYEVDSAAEVGVIFEVMNNRGKPLSDLEKVKNFLLYAGSTIAIPHELDTAVNGAWAEILRQLMAAGLTTSTAEDQLLRAHWRTSYDPQPRGWNGSKTVRERLDRRSHADEASLLAGLVTYTQDLRASCFGYCDAFSPERAESFASIADLAVRDEVKQWSSKLLRVNVVVPFLPLLIATRIRFSGDGAKYLELVKLCESFAFRVYRMIERRADAGQGMLFRIGYQLKRGELEFDDALRQVRATLKSFASDASFEAALRAEQANWYQWTGIKYFLYEYEEHLANEKGAAPKISWDFVRRRERSDTIEHILPQTPTDPYWLEHFDDDARKRLLHDVGNLCLTKDNSSYGNKSFPAKKGSPGSGKPCYAESSFFSERELATLPDWDGMQLEARRTRLIEWALVRWSVGGDVSEAEIVDGYEELQDSAELADLGESAGDLTEAQ